MPKVAFMYWQKRFDRKNLDKELEEKIFEIRKLHKDYGYQRILGELRNQNIVVNKKKVQRIMQKLGLQVTSFTSKSRKYTSYKGRVGTVYLIEFEDALIHIYLIKKSQLIQKSLSIMKWILKGI